MSSISNSTVVLQVTTKLAEWPGLAQVYRLEREFQWRRNGKCYRTSHEIEFGITSLTRALGH